MRSKIVSAVVFAALALVSVPAFAKGDAKASFPMPAAEFKAKVDARAAKAKQRMEARAATLPADQAKELRAKFDAGTAQINQEVAKAIADGTVTTEEAQKVREVAKAVHPHSKGHGKRAKKK